MKYLFGSFGVISSVFVYNRKTQENPKDFRPKGEPDHKHFGLPTSTTEERTYSHYSVNYDKSKRTSLWSQHILTKSSIEGNASRKRCRFGPDPSISDFSSYHSDYRHSGYSRGHLSPSMCFKFDQDAMCETFYTTNIVPQDAHQNQTIWNFIENFLKNELLKKFEYIWVVTGPAYIHIDDFLQVKIIGNNKLWVPTHMYKVVLCQVGKQLYIGAFLVANTSDDFSKNLADHMVPVEDLEKHLGFTFFSELDRTDVQDLANVVKNWSD